MERHFFMISRALNARKRKIFALFFALAASIGLSYALTPKGTDVWDDATKTLTVNSNPQDDYYNDQGEIKRLVISSSVTEIGEQAFSSNYNLQEVIAYDGLQVIDQSAFFSCPNLVSVILPSTLREVRYSAFSYCDNLKYVTINASSLEEYQEYAFDDTHADLKIYVPAESVATYKSNWSAYADKIVAIGSDEPAAPAATEVTITNNDFPGMDVSFTKDGVTVSADWIDNMQSGNLVGPGSFSTTLGNFTKIEVNAGEIGSLGEGWSGNPERQTWTGNASSVSFSGDIMGLGHGITIMCTIEESGSSTPAWVKPGDSWDESTKTLTVNSNPGNYAYGEAEDIEHLIISSTVTEIGEQAFAMCINLETIDFSEGLQNINNEAFTSCEKLESVILPSTLKWVGTLVFSYDEKLKSVTINASSLDYYGSLAFEYTHADLKIYVPAESVATYKSNWSGYADRIEAIGGGSAEPVDPTEGIEVPEGGEIFVLTDSIMKREEGEFMFAYDGEGWVAECQYMIWHTQTMNAESRWNRTTMNMVGTDGPEFGSNKANVVRLEINFASTTGGGALAEGWSLSGNKYIWTGSSKSVRFYHTGATISGITSVVYVFDGKCHRDPQRFTTSVLAEDLIVGDTLAMGAQLISEVYGGFYLDANRVRYHGVVQTQNFRSTFSQLGAVSKHGAMDNEYPEIRGCLEPINDNGELGEEWIVISLDPLHIAGIGTASAVTNTCYTSEVDYAALEPGDTIAYGASIINTPEKVWFRANRMQRSNSGETFIIEDDRYMEGSYGTFGKNGVITDKYGTTFAPINEQGTLGGKWVVVFYSPLTIAGIGEPAIELTLSKDVSIIGLPIAGINDIGDNNYEVEPGTQFQIQAAPAPAHYSFVGWSDLASTDPNYSANPRTIVADKNLTIEPIFAIDTYIVTLASNDSTMGTLRVEGAGGSNIGPKEEINIYHGVVGEHYQVLGEYSGASWIGVGGNDNKTITVESLNGEIIDNITLEVYMPSHWTGYSIAATSGNVSGDVANYQDLVITNINATSVTLSRVGEGENGGSVLFSEIIVNGRDAQQGGQAEPITVTWTSADMPSSGNANSFTLDGVTITCGGIGIDWGWKDFQGNGTFTTDLGNFTKIEVNTEYCEMDGEGWSGVSNKMTWTGNAASVSYNGSIMGCLSIVFTIEPAAPAASGIVDNGDGTYTVDWGTEMSIIAEPKEDYMLASWNGEPALSDTLKQTVEGALSINATFKHIPAVITLPEGVSIVGLPIEGITSKGEGVYEVEYGTEFQISADIIPEHYHFDHWADLADSAAMYAANPRTIVAGENLTVEPIFAIDTYTLTLASNDTTMGVVSLEGAGQGDEPQPTTVTFTNLNNVAKVVENITLPHTFSCDYTNGNGELDLIIQESYNETGGRCSISRQWPWGGNDNEVVVGHDGNNHFVTINAPFVGTSFMSGYYDGSSFGNFYYSFHITIAAAAPAAASGIVDNGDGTYTVDYGTELTFVAKPAEGFMLESWSNGAEVTGDTLKLTMTEELSLTANFKHIPATITLPEGVSIVGMPIEGITSKGEGGYEVEYGTEFQISADIIPEHYHFGHWADLDTEDAMYAANPRTIVASENLTVEPFYAIDTYTLTLASNDETMGTLRIAGIGEEGGLQEPSAQLIVPESWSSEVGVTITAADLPGFVASTEEAVKALPVPTEGSVFVIYNFKDDGGVEAVTFENGEYVRTTSTKVDHANASYYSNQGMIFLYTTAAGQAGQGGEGGEGEEQDGIVDNGNGTYIVDWGTELSIVAVPAKDYHLVNWNGEPAESDTLKVTVTNELSVSAFFKHDTYILTVEGAEVEIAKFADGTTDAVVLNPGTLVGVQEGDSVKLTTTATFSSANVADNLDITLHYAIEVIEDGIYDNEYALAITDSIYAEKGFILEPMTPDKDAAPEEQEAENEEGLEIYAYGYCHGSSYSIAYHLKSGKPDQYKIDFEDGRFTDVDWTDLSILGADGVIDIEIPVDLPTGDYSMTVTFRDSRFTFIESNPITVSFHVNLPETYVVALFDNVMAVVDTCECLTDIQWYWRANSTDQWTAIEGATGYYYKQEGGLTGEFFIKAKMNGIDTYTCPQEDLSLYGDTKQAKVSAYPNPVQNTTTVTIENSRAWNHTIRIVNLMGNEMMTGSFEGNETTIDMSGYTFGNYMISVDGIVVKVIKK